MPQKKLSRLAGWLSNCEVPWVKNYLIRYFITHYPVNMSEAIENDPFAYPNFSAFFTRALKPELRLLDNRETVLISPVDGCISQIGYLENDRLIQAKDHHFSVKDVLGGDEKTAEFFKEGAFATLYLAPHDYHRVHMPFSGKLLQMIYIPGSLFSVNARTAASIPQLFARNERVVALFDTALGRMAVILVGAMIVGSIETVWAGTVAPQNLKTPETTHYSEIINLNRGEEMGRFKLGSTVILLFEKEAVRWETMLKPLDTIRLGQALGSINLKI